MNDAGKVLLSFFVGATAGAVTGILLAPEKGDKTREKLMNEAEKYKGELDTKFKQGVDRFNELKDSLGSVITNAENEAKNLASSKKS